MSLSNRVSRSSVLVHGPVVALLCGVSLLIGGCGNGSKADKPAASQVAIKINGGEVSEHQVNLLLERLLPNVPPEQAPAVMRRVLDGLVEQELAAQAARKDGLDQDPRVVQRMEAAKREVLAQAYQERLSNTAVEPSSDEVDRYYESHPALFSQRRLYSLQETAVAFEPERFEAIKARVQAAASLEKMSEVLRAESLKSTSRQTSLSAEDVPLVILDQMAALKEGQSMVLPREGGARVLTLLSTQASPISRPTAVKLIAAYLTKERQRQAAQVGVKALRDVAKVEFVGRYAQSAAPAAPASAVAAPALAAASQP